MAMKEFSVSEFDDEVYRNLVSCGFDFSAGKAIGAAVSGGADSVSLLLCLSRLGKRFGFGVKVITVNHNIRSAEESGGDAAFVRDLCSNIFKSGYDVHFFEKVLEPGIVGKLAFDKGLGIEATARVLRYKAFDKFARMQNLDFVALAHNKNDQIETLLMRFLQGSGAAGLGGIRMCRDGYVRPLITLCRSDIEEYIMKLGFSWRTDSTNFDNHYMRNRIRNELVPFLREKFAGFETALLAGAEKSAADEELISELAEVVSWEKNDDGVFCLRSRISSLKKAVRTRVLFNGLDVFCSSFSVECRFPFRSMAVLMERIERGESFSVDFSDFTFVSDDEYICFKKRALVATDSVFFVIIKENGVFQFPFGDVYCSVRDGLADIRFDFGEESFEMEKLQLPFCIRSVQPGDKIRAADGSMKSVQDVLSDWHAGAMQKRMIPVVQDLCDKNQGLVALLGCVCGLSNWIVRG
ncbi:MAG: tRNA lysidine(34) synthetase TilS [Treponema sp.]|nr:tRNA lysidine(34) synthetase TilS [Treponema sp.]